MDNNMGPLYDRMLKYHVEHYRQLILLYGVAILLVLSFFLSYLPMKRPRDPRTYQPEDAPQWRSWRENWGFIPWIIVLVFVAVFLYCVIQVILKSMYPPNY